MALLNHKHTTPVDGWFFIDPNTGVKLETLDTLSDLVRLVIEHREHRKVGDTDAEKVELEIQRQLCSAMPPGWCAPEPGETYVPFNDRARDFTPELILAASKTGLAWIASGMELVSDAEAERRASICRRCRFNRSSPSWVCASICGVIEKMIPEGRRYNGLHFCGLCQCSLRAKVNLPLHVIRPENEAREIRFPAPPACWQSET